MKKYSILFLMTMLTFAVTGQELGDIMENYYKAVGAENWQEIHALKMSGTVAMQGMEFPITVYASRPNHEKVVIDFQGMQIIEAYDGKVAWNVNPFEGRPNPTLADEDATREAASKSFEEDLINYQEKGHKLTLEGSEVFNGKDAYKLMLTKTTGQEMVYYLDAETYLTAGLLSTAATGPMKGQQIETAMEDYRQVDGVSIPMTFKHKANGQIILESKMEDLELNAEFDKAIYTMPAEK